MEWSGQGQKRQNDKCRAAWGAIIGFLPSDFGRPSCPHQIPPPPYPSHRIFRFTVPTTKHCPPWPLDSDHTVGISGERHLSATHRWLSVVVVVIVRTRPMENLSPPANKERKNHSWVAVNQEQQPLLANAAATVCASYIITFSSLVSILNSAVPCSCLCLSVWVCNYY